MFRPRIFYVFRRPIKQKLQEAKKSLVPRDIFYGLTEIQRIYPIDTTDRVFWAKHILMGQQFVNLLVSKFMDIGFSLIPAFYLLKELKQSDLIFATVDTYGLPIALFKKMRLLRKPLIWNTIGLYDAYIQKKNPFTKYLFKTLMLESSMFVAGGSLYECKQLAQTFTIPLKKFTFIPFGIDTKYFTPSRKLPTNEILIIGADPSRDWKLYAQVINQFPRESFRIITQPHLIKVKMPENVIIEYNLPYSEIRKRIRAAKYLLILSRHNYHFAGQSTAMRAMSCGKPVIFTHTPGVEEYAFKNYFHCIMVKPNELKNIIKAMNWLNHSPKKRLVMGRHARNIIRKAYTIEQYAKQLRGVFDTISSTI